ncbi:MAG: Opr family porin [Helicobacteraceae bacterium]|nr:Opr family porin [Helicobacteraceae bacterium]
MKNISIVVALALFGSAAFAAGETSIEGVVYGDLTNHSEKQNNGEKQSLFVNGSVNVGFASGDVYNGLSFNLGARGNRKLFEKEDGDWGDANRFDSTVFHTANLTYSNDLLTVVAGRQEIALEWLGDYHEAIVGIVKPAEALTVIAGYTGKYAESDYDGYYGGFEDDVLTLRDENGVVVISNKKQGAYVVEAIIAPVEGLAIEPWYYLVPDVADWFGGKVAFENDLFNASAAYTISKLDKKSTKNMDDGGVLHIQAGIAPAEGINAYAGFAATDEDGGAGGLSAVGENVSPFEDGDNFFNQETTTIYIGAGYEADALSVGALLGVFDTGSKGGKGSINELDLTAGYGFTDWFSLNATLVSVFGGDKAYKDTDYTSLRVAAIFNY